MAKAIVDIVDDSSLDKAMEYFGCQATKLEGGDDVAGGDEYEIQGELDKLLTYLTWYCQGDRRAANNLIVER